MRMRRAGAVGAEGIVRRSRALQPQHLQSGASARTLEGLASGAAEQLYWCQAQRHQRGAQPSPPNRRAHCCRLPPRSPPMVAPEVEECKCKPSTTTTCNAGLCDEAESETEVNGGWRALQRSHALSVCDVRSGRAVAPAGPRVVF